MLHVFIAFNPYGSTFSGMEVLPSFITTIMGTLDFEVLKLAVRTRLRP